MQDLNEDPDEQFRVAVDKVTLKPADSKWDELSGKIISIKRTSMATIRVKYRKRMMVLALFMLLPVALFFLMPMFSSFDRTQGKKTGVRFQKNSTENINQKTTNPHKSDSQIQNPVVTFSQSQSPANVEALTISPEQSNTAGVAETHLPLQDQFVSFSSKQTKSETTSNRNTDQGNRAATGSAGKEDGIAVFDFSNSSFSGLSAKPLTVELAESDALHFPPIYAKTDASAFETGTESLTHHSNTYKNFTLQHLDYPHRQGFYLGLVGGPMLTQVKHQGTTKSGFDFGILAGYTLSKKFSIETELFYTRQYFYVSGPYYNEFANINDVSSLQGSRKAFEISLNLKYNVIRSANGNFFVTAGTSTYSGTNDKILIKVKDSVPPPSQNFDAGITSLLPSYVNISLGYEYKIGKFADIRIEPYFQIPLNINTGNSFKTQDHGGSIQVFNSGIHIVISRFIR